MEILGKGLEWVRNKTTHCYLKKKKKKKTTLIDLMRALWLNVKIFNTNDLRVLLRFWHDHDWCYTLPLRSDVPGFPLIGLAGSLLIKGQNFQTLKGQKGYATGPIWRNSRRWCLLIGPPGVCITWAKRGSLNCSDKWFKGMEIFIKVAERKKKK